VTSPAADTSIATQLRHAVTSLSPPSLRSGGESLLVLVCVQPHPLALNMALPAFSAERRAATTYRSASGSTQLLSGDLSEAAEAQLVGKHNVACSTSISCLRGTGPVKFFLSRSLAPNTSSQSNLT